MASRLSAAFRAGASSVVIAAVTTSCANESRQEATSQGPAASASNRAAARSATCQDCVLNREPECRSAYEACIANVKCSRVALCEFERGCLATASTEKDCLRLCLSTAGIRALTDPAFPLVMKLNLSTHTRCRSACGAS